jgi:hypothetical protein
MITTTPIENLPEIERDFFIFTPKEDKKKALPVEKALFKVILFYHKLLSFA